MTYNIGDRVRWVYHDEAVGTVTGDVVISPVDGGPRQSVRWDNSGHTSSWSPDFYRPIDEPVDNDPLEVVSGNIRMRKDVNVDVSLETKMARDLLGHVNSAIVIDRFVDGQWQLGRRPSWSVEVLG